jgi:hypothetical protein
LAVAIKKRTPTLHTRERASLLITEYSKTISCYYYPPIAPKSQAVKSKKKAVRRAREQGANIALIEIVTPDLTWAVVQPAVKRRLGRTVQKALVYCEGELHPVVKRKALPDA